MNALLAELTRWNQPIRGGAVIDRWTAWALSLRDRHARVLLPGQAAAMTTIAPWPVVSRVERWTRFALSLTPRIDVAISAVLRQVSPGLVRHQITHTVATAPQRDAINSPFAPASPSTLVTAAGVSPGPAPVSAARASAFAGSPVERVLARLSEAPLAWAGRASAPPADARRSRELFERMVHERRRVEERVHQIIIEERPQSVSWIAEPPVRPRMSGVSHSWGGPGTPHGAPAPWGSRAADVDIDHLTEQVVRQIDHRVTALRERLGYPA